MAKKEATTKTQWDEYKLRVETKSGDLMKVKATLFSPRDDRQGVSLVIMDDLVIKGLWIINGKNGPFISWPSYKQGDTYSDYAHPISAEFRESLYDQLLKLCAFKEDGED